MSFDKIRLDHILFLDIETVPLYGNFEQVPGTMQKFWERKARHIKKEDETPGQIYHKAGIYSEFGKIICISVGTVVKINGKLSCRTKSFYGDDEKKLLQEFFQLVDKSFSADYHRLCGHNGKEFDFPYLARRGLINRLKIPTLLNTAGKKPWEVQHLDTLELWKFGDYKHFTSLALLTELFDIPTPKDDIDGSDVYKVYWHDKDLLRIVKYCEKDVIALIQLFLRFRNMDLIEDENITSVSFPDEN